MAYDIVGSDVTIWYIPDVASVSVIDDFLVSRQDLPKAVDIDTYDGMPSLILRYQSTAQGPNKLKSLLAGFKLITLVTAHHRPILVRE